MSSPRKYDVFLSFRGEDTRTAFTDHLYKALTNQGINTYRDDENLRAGDLISPKLSEAIAASRFGIVVLSSGYATSPWCLDELAYIVDCMEKMELIVIPVFYHVDPSDVRQQRNTFEQAFAKHETSNRFAPEKVKTWRAAFRKVGDIVGSHVQGTRYESEEISKIVRRIFKDLQDTLPRDATRGLIGIESRVEELKSLLNMESNDVRFIGICGMSGMGKTTLAEVVYEGIRDQFQGCSFIGNIKDISRKNDSDLCKLQQKLLVDILKDERIRVRSVIEGVSMLQERLYGLKIIIVLDDVNLPDQLNFLSREREWFGPGSRIIMTTTNEDLLKVHRVDRRYKCEGLTLSDATRLFNLSAFVEGQPKHGYAKLSSDIVELAGGLPLALNTFGSLLFGKGEEYWRETLEKLQQFPEEEILQRLEICYDRLGRNEKEIFIYIACFLKGRDEVLVKDILKNIGKHPVRGIDILKNRSLITINYDDSVWMHDLLQQMGWEVLCKEFPRQPGKRVGLKCRKDIVDICTSEEKGTKAIEIINQEQYRAEVENCIGDRESFSKMKKLKFLRISNDLPNLRSINLCCSEDLTEIPDLTSIPKLLKLNLEGCTNLTELHKSLLAHKSLRYVNLKGCRKLQSLGNNMEMDDLEALHLSGCSKLEHIPEFGENMKCLEHLYLDGTKIKRLPESLGKIRSLRKLDVSETAIEELPSFLLHLERLRLLHIHGCHLLSLTRTFHSMVRTERIVIPEAIFEIVVAGSEIPPWFNLVESHSVETKHHGIWDVFNVNFDRCIGVALCAVIAVPHSLDNMRGAYIEVKYEVVAHIHVASKYWRIPVPINFLEAELETQLVWYWPVTDDLQGAVHPSQKNQFEISFSVEPEDGNLEVKKYGVRFLCREDILDLRGSGISINGIPSIMKKISFFCDFSDPDTIVASRKRKATPRWTEQVQVCPGTGLEGPLDDVQKDILGAKYPRVKRSIKVPAISNKLADIPPDEYSWAEAYQGFSPPQRLLQM